MDDCHADGRRRRRPRSLTVDAWRLPALLVCLLCLLSRAPYAADGAVISAIYPSQLGVHGGATVTIHGSGFSRDGQEGTTSVFLGTRECVQELYHFTDGQIVCEAPPMGPGSSTVEVTVAITAISSASFARCDDGSCTVQYRGDRTPYLQGVPAGAAPFEAVRLSGSLTGGYSLHQYVIRMGDELCDPNEALNPEEPVYDDKDVFCYAPAELTPGHYNMSLVIQASDTTSSRSYGLAGVDEAVLQVGVVDDTPFTTAMHAEVHGVSYGVAGVRGGAPLTITGTGFGFDAAAVTVTAAGVPCRVTGVTNTRIKCVPGPVDDAAGSWQPANTSHVFPGGRGVLLERFDGTPCGYECAAEWARGQAKTRAPDEVRVLGTSFDSPVNVGSNFVWHASSVFVPPVTANYSFWSRGDDYVEVHVGTDVSRDHMRMVSLTRRYYNTFYHRDEQRSAPVFLKAGQRVYMEAWSYEAGGGDWFDIGVRIMQGESFQTSWLQQKYSSISEVQMYSFRAEVVREVQEITVVGAVGGTFSVGLVGDNSKLSEKLSYDASASDVDGTLSDLGVGCRYLSVSRRDVVAPNSTTVIGYTWAITYGCSVAGTFPSLKVLNTGLVADNFDDLDFSTERVQLASAPLAGTVRFGLNGTWTAPVGVHAHRNTVQERLQEAFPHFKDITVESWGTDGEDQHYRITTRLPVGDQPLLEVDNSTMTGYRATVETREYVRGSTDLLYTNIPADMLETGMPHPSVVVNVNGVTAVCPVEPTPNPYGEGDASVAGANPSRCAFEYRNATTPVVLAVSPTTTTGSGDVVVSVTEGDTITISGTNFASTVGGNIVEVGTARCVVSAASASSITCTMGHGVAGTHTLSVLVVAGAGYAEVAVGAPRIVFNARIDSAAPLVGSVAGGTHVTIDGTGFDADAHANNVTMGSAPCVVVSATSSRLVCASPSLLDAAPLNAVDGARVRVHVNGNEATGVTFQYRDAATPTVVSVAPRAASAAASTEININGTNFCGGGAGCPVSVTFGSRECEVSSVTNTSIACVLLKYADSWHLARDGEVDGPTQPLVRVHGLGRASVPASGDTAVDVRFVITSISTHNGSLAGGTRIRIQGAGFKTWYADTSVEFTVNWLSDAVNHFPDEDPVCHIDGITDTEINCTTAAYERPAPMPDDPPRAPLHKLSGRISVVLNRVVAACASNCSFTMSTDHTPTVMHAAAAGGTLMVMGSKFAGDTEVHVGGRHCPVTARVGSTRINCTLPAHAAGTYDVRVRVPALGWARSTATHTYGLHVHGISATRGSTEGGTTVHVTGDGFAMDADDNVVTFGGAAGTVLSATHSMLTVLTPPHPLVDGGAMADLPVMVRVMGEASGDDAGHSGGHRRMLMERAGHMFDGLHVARETATLVGDTRASALHDDHPVVLSVFADVDAAGDFDEVAAAVAEHQLQASGPQRRLAEVVAHAMASDSFTYDASLAYTPVVNHVMPASGKRGTMLRVMGSGFGTGADNVTVVIGGASCTVDAASWSARGFNCTVGDTPGGAHKVGVTVAGKGLAKPASMHATMFTAMMGVATTSPHMGGYGGGTRVTVTGFGFVSHHVGAASGLRTAIRMCNAECSVVSATYDSISCHTPALLNMEALDALHHVEAAAVEGSVVSDGFSDDDAAAAFDGDVETLSRSYGSARYSCSIGLDVGADSAVVLTRVRFFPEFHGTRYLQDGVFEGSMDGETYAVLATVDRAHEGWNFMDITPTPPPYRFLRYRGGTSDHRCRMMETEYVGHKVTNATACNFTAHTVATQEAGEGSDGGDGGHGSHRRLSMDMAASPGSAHAPADQAFAYSVAQTPTVTSVSPNYGTARGGTYITVTGTGFSSMPAHMHVTIDGDYPCRVTASTPTTVTCVTAPRPTVRPHALTVMVHGKGLAVSDARQPPVWFRYLDKWSELSTWAYRERPVEGDSVVIPEGQTVLMDVSPPRLFLLLVQGTLVFDRRDLTLDASYIFVQGGTLEIGTEADPFLHSAVITLHGDRFGSIEIPHVGAKVLGVADRTLHHGHGGGYGPGVQAPWDTRGTLDIHGRPRKRTWTKLESSALAGSTTLVVSEDVDYEAGERLIVTSADYNPFGIEEVTVASLGADSRTIHLTAPLARDHVSGMYDGPDGRVVDMRLEVGLLSRNVIVRGDDHSPSQSFGAHTIAVHGGTYRVENAEFTRCGQSHVLGRYCTHSHMAAGMAHSYVKSNSIHHSFQRAVTVHGTHHMRVEHNVAFDVKGHTFFVEDGVETYNRIEGNLGGLTRVLVGMLKSDATGPATFWTSGPTNVWRHNVAAGSMSHGMWFELPGAPHGPSFTTTVCPSSEPLGEFFNNTVHSNGNMGLRIYPQYHPHQHGCSGPEYPAYFRSLTSFHNSGEGAFCRSCGRIHWVDFNVVEVNGPFASFKKFDVEYNWDPNIVNLMAVAHRDPTDTSGSNVAVFAPQDEFFYVSGAKIVNFHDSGALAGCNKCASDQNLKQGAFTVRWRGLEFINSTRRTRWTKPFKQIFWDLDGTLTGYANGTATPFRAWNNHLPACPHMGAEYDNGIVCDNSVVVRRLSIDRVEPREMDWKVMQLNSTAGKGPMEYLPKEISGWVAPVVSQRRYHITWDTLVDWRSSRLQYSVPQYVTPTEWLGMSFSYIDSRWNFEVHHRGQLVPWLNDTVPLPTDPIGTGWNDAPNGTWHVVMSDFRSFGGMDAARYRVDVAALQCPPDGCKVPPAPTVGNAKRWSDPATWPDEHIPQEGEDVTIPSTLWVLLDVTPPVLGAVVVEGKLSFEDVEDLTLEAASLTVWGSFHIGSAHAPHQHEAVVRLHGVRQSPSVVLDNALFLGNKVMPVLGEVQMHGKPVGRSWVRLGATADVGDTVLTLASPVTWAAGDELVLTPTEYDISELEEVVVKDVSADGLLVQLEAAVQHRHYAGTLNTGGSATVGAAVGHLRRNVRFEGALLDDADTYGAHVVVTEILRTHKVTGEVTLRSGWVHASNVQFHHCGKQGMEHASIFFNYNPSSPRAPHPNIMQECTFSHNFNYAVVADKAPNVRLVDNVFHRNFRSAIDLLPGSTNATIIGNLVAGSFRSPDETLDWLRPIAGFFVQEVPYQMSGNVAAACADAGFTFVADSCAAVEAGTHHIFDNEAHGVMVGGYLLPRSGCIAVDGFTAWKAAHVGLQTVDQGANVLLRRITVSDSHIGLHLHFVKGGKANWVRVTDSVLGGASPASTCGASTTCLAMTKGDVVGTSCNSVLGTQFRHVGLMVPQYQSKGKTCGVAGGIDNCRPPNMPERMCVLPWEERYGVAGALHAEVHMERVTFANFDSDTCGGAMRSAAVVNNPRQPDYSPLLTFKQTTWHATAWDDRFHLGDKANTFDACVSSSCDAVNFLMLQDVDGSLDLHGTGGGAAEAGSTLLGHNPGLGNEDCASRSEWGGLVCGPALPLRRAAVENVDRDRGFRRIGPIHVKRLALPGSAGSNRSSWAVGPFKEPCSMQGHFGQFPLALAPGHVHEVRATGTTPANMRMHFFSRDASEAVMVSFFLQKAFRLDVFVGGVKVPRTTALPTLTDVAGTNQFDPHLRRVLLVMRGDASGGPAPAYDIRRTPIVALTLHLAVTIDDFFGDKLVRNLALLLRIDASRIKIVNVRVATARRLGQQDGEPSGELVLHHRRLAPAVYADIEIEDEATPSVNDTETEAQVVRLNKVVTEITQHLGNGTFEVGYSVLDVEVLPPQIALDVSEDGADTVPAPIRLKPKSNPPQEEGLPSWVLWAVIVGGGLILLVTIVASLAWYRRERDHQRQALVGSKVAHVTVVPSDANTPPHRMRGSSRKRWQQQQQQQKQQTQQGGFSPAPTRASPDQVRFSHSNPMHKPSPGDGSSKQGSSKHGSSKQGRDPRTPQREEVPLPNSGSMRDVTYRHVGRTAFAPTTAVSALEQPQLPPVHLTPAQKAHFQFTQAYTGWNRGADL